MPPELKKILKKIYARLEDWIIPTETIQKSKLKWNVLARKNFRYYVWTTRGKDISDKELYDSGKDDYQKYIADDPLLKTTLADFKDKTMLEVGCGIGRMTQHISEQFSQVYGIDIADELIVHGRERLKDKSNVRLLANNGILYPLPDGSCDLVFSYLVFQHMSDKNTVLANLRETRRVLKKGGIAKIQFRGVPIYKFRWSYGISFNLATITTLLRESRLNLVHHSGEGEKNFWLWLSK